MCRTLRLSGLPVDLPGLQSLATAPIICTSTRMQPPLSRCSAAHSAAGRSSTCWPAQLTRRRSRCALLRSQPLECDNVRPFQLALIQSAGEQTVLPSPSHVRQGGFKDACLLLQDLRLHAVAQQVELHASHYCSKVRLTNTYMLCCFSAQPHCSSKYACCAAVVSRS